MEPFPTIAVDLDLPPEQRWEVLRPYAGAVRELCAMYIKDLGAIAQYEDLLDLFIVAQVAPEYRMELDSIAAVVGVSTREIALSNLYYDAIKVAIGCTAFSVPTATGMLHARNLDWWSIENALAQHTVVIDYRRGGAVVYRVVGWPGYIGCLSGVAVGRFAVSLNAVLSEDAPELAEPISLLLRRVLEEASSYEVAVGLLRDTPIATDCLLLVTGIVPGQACVLERTPTRAAVRTAVDGPVVVTNNYLSGLGGDSPQVGALAETSCGRLDRVVECFADLASPSVEGCFAILRDPDVEMGITMQQMVMSAVDGSITLRRPASAR